MKILLVGPYPPPHGGVSVHLAGIERKLAAAGIAHRVLDTSRVRNWGLFVASLVRSALSGWTIHFHANGHNWKDWSIAWVCGSIGNKGSGSILTLHSGLTPEYLSSAPSLVRTLAKWTCSLHARVICVSQPIRNSLASLGVHWNSVDVADACLGIGTAGAVSDATILSSNLANWIHDRQPLLSTTLFFRPEYAFDTLVRALERLRQSHPDFGCVVMGSGEEQTQAEKGLREIGLEANVFLAGDIEHDTCLNLMSRSDVFLRGTLRDGDSISVREALALGVPVVASRTAFRPEGVMLFPPGDAGAMANAIEAALEIGGRREIKESNSTDRLMAIYREALAAEVA